jgi:WD40 repeat protein
MARPDQVDGRQSARPNPYVGPRAIRSGEPFHGRDREIAELCDILVAERIVLLYSPSGAGKSSLLEAGIRPELQRRDFRVVPTIRVRHEDPSLSGGEGDGGPVPSPNRYTFSALLSLEEDRPPDRQLPLADLARTTIGDYLDRIAGETDKGLDLCLFLDQLEELFTLDPTDQDRKAEFLAELGRGLRDRGRWAVLAMREDYIAQLDPYRGLIPRRLAARVRLDLLGPSAAKAAMCRTAEDQGVRFAPEAADALVDDLRTVRVRRPEGPSSEFGPVVEPVQLQVVCRQLWTTLPTGVDVIGPDLLAAVGDVDDALATFYDERLRVVAAATGTPERELRDWFDDRLVTPQGFRAQVLDGPGTNGAAVLRELEDAHLIRADRRRGTEWYELAHDRLIAPLQTSNARWREAHLSSLQRDAQIWERQSRRPELLLRGDDLREASDWATDHPDELAQVDREFLDASERDERARRVRARRRVAAFGVLVVLLVLALGLAVAAKRSSDRARSAQQLSDSQRLGLQATAVSPADPQLGGLLGLEALRRGATPAARAGLSAARDGLNEWPINTTVPGGAIVDVAFTPDGEAFATATDDGAVLLWDTASRTVRGELRPVVSPGPHLTAMALSPRGDRLATADEAGGVDVTAVSGDGRQGAPPLHLVGHIGAVDDVEFSADGALVASAGADGTARLWATSDGTLVRTIAVGAVVRSVALSPDGTQVATGSDDHEARVWAAADGSLQRELIAHDGPVTAVAYSPGGDVLVTGSDDWTAVSWNARTGARLHRHAGHLGGITDIAFSPDGALFATSSSDFTAVVWDTNTGDSLRTLTGHTEPLVSLAFAPDASPGGLVAGAPLLLTGSAGPGDHTARLWRDPAGGTRRVLGGHPPEVTGLAWSRDGTLLATASRDGTVRLWSATSGEPVRVLGGGRGPLYGVAFGPDGGLVAAASEGGAVMWDTKTGAERQIVGTASPIYSVAFSPDGSLLATGGRDGSARLWSTVTGQQVAELRGHNGTVNAVSFAPDGTMLATGSDDHTAALWDVRTGVLERRLVGHSGPVYGVAFSPDGKQLATPSHDHTVRLWRTDDGSTVRVFTGHTDYVFSAAFSPDGAILATASNDHTARLWDVRSGFGLGSTTSKGGPLYSVAFSPDQDAWSVAAYDGTARVLSCLVCRPVEETASAVKAQLTRGLSAEERQLYLSEG